ncbi:MAG: glycoside hydrolase family 38 C-terminal domain-containing protein [Solirubrobacteraceae bacterium]
MARTFYVVPHTHWDREWYRPFEYFQLRLGAVVDGVLDVLERDPAFTTFTLDGQAIVLEDYVDARPEHEARLCALVGAGRIEIGPSYMLPDELLVGAEPLVRNLLMGRAVCRRFGGDPSPIGYLPDSFGHPAQLPQILAGFGIRTFVFSRGMGDELEDVGSIFRWRAPDGSEVLAFQLLDHYGNFAFISGVQDAADRVRHIVGRFGDLLDRAGVQDVLLCNGTDHVPVMPELPRLCTELEREFPDSRFTIARYQDYVTAVGDVSVPAWSGELLGSRIQNVLRGVNSARMYVKRANEEAERRLLEVETLGALASLHDGRVFPTADFALAWRALLHCQPHDTICGCSCDEVHRDALARYESLHRSLSVLQTQALVGLATGDAAAGVVGVVNVLPFRRRGLIEGPGIEPQLVELDGFAAATVEVAPAGPPAEAGAASAAEAIENDRFRVSAAADGTLTVLDKEHGHSLDGLHRLEDEADMGDLYNFCPTPEGEVWRAGHASVRVLRAGPLLHELEVRVEAERPAGLDGDTRPLDEQRPLAVTTVVRLVQGAGRVEFQTTIDNHTCDHRLRVAFPIGTVEGPVRAETAFALVRRDASPPQPRAHWVEPPDPTQHTLGAVAAGAVALVTKGLPEYELRQTPQGSELCLTLLRCVGIISQVEGALSTRPHTAGPQVATPEGQCLGRHRFEYALLPSGGTLDDVALLRAAQDYRHGLLTTDEPVRLEPPLALEGEVVFSCLKGAEDGDGLILRCFNPSDSPAAVRVLGQVDVLRTRLDETGETAIEDGAFEVQPGEAATLRLRRA